VTDGSRQAGQFDALTQRDGSRQTSDAPEAAKPRERDRGGHSTDRNGSRTKVPTVERAPGQVHADPPVDIWPDGAADGLRQRWRELQLRFVDDPQAAAKEADDVLANTIELLNGSLQAARTDLSDQCTKNDADTEGLRVAVQRYRSVVDRVLAL
jgi:hypothetical protein